MGNILEKVSSNPTTSISALTAISLLCYILYESREKRQFRKKMLAISSSNQLGDFQKQMNDVYLKDIVDHHELRNTGSSPIYKIAITGGPCAGKSASLKKLKDVFTEKGFRVLMVPEVPTMVVVAGGMILMSKFNCQERVKFQSLLIRFQMYAEDYFTKLAQMSDQPAIVLCDRGTVDPYAYIPTEEFQAVLDSEGWSWVTLRDRRYDRVCFLRTAADGAEDFYTLENNQARSEGLEVARDIDKRTLEAWTGHPHLTVVPNVKGETFSDKIDRVIEAVSKTVGEEMRGSIYNKFLIEKPNFPPEIKAETSSIEETFLLNEDPQFSEVKLKKRGSNNSFTYQLKHTFAKKQDHISREVRQPLTSLEYITKKEKKIDPNFETVSRERISFVYNNLSYQIDVYPNLQKEGPVYLLRFYSKKGENAEYLIPKFIQIIGEVSKDNKYKLKHISEKKKIMEQN